MKGKVIVIKDLSVSYDRNRVLSNIFLQIEQGTIYGIIGPNGAGKSTLIKAVLGLVDINQGHIEVLGSNSKQVAKKLVYVPQRDNVDWTFPATVLDVVLMGRYPHKKFLQRIDQNDKQIAVNACQQLGIEDLMDVQIGELSGGQQQRVFLARAICQGAEIFFLDEPFVGVDVTTEEKIVSILKKLSSKGKTILVVHHDLSTVENYFDQVILLNQRLIASGPAKKVFTKENISKTYQAQLTILHKTGMIN